MSEENKDVNQRAGIESNIEYTKNVIAVIKASLKEQEKRLEELENDLAKLGKEPIKKEFTIFGFNVKLDIDSKTK